jgi:hypothetical protein
LAFKGGCCQLCGYDACLAALTFHHVDPSKKRFNIAGSHSRSWDSQRREVAKCIVVCANCHREIHAGYRAIPRELSEAIARETVHEEHLPRRPEGRPRFSAHARE